MQKTELNKLVAPFVKWVGGKRQLIPVIKKNLPKSFGTYVEPFIGGGAVLFSLQPGKAIINDFNDELINLYRIIKNDVEALIEDLKHHKNEPDYFYKIRSLDRSDSYRETSDVKRASRIIFLNKTCYNGLYRVNSAGEYNAPFGKYKNPNIVNEETLRAVSEYLNQNQIQITCGDFEEATKGLKENDFVYFDPPYDPVSKSANFTGYVQGGFDSNAQIRLRDVCKSLDERGVYFMVSNSDTPFINELYQDFNIQKVKAKRAINSDSQKRGAINELLIKNYE
ncbi:MAG: DNA adenine methylase [Saprospiraceae bacterium]